MGCRACLSDRTLLPEELTQLNNFSVGIDTLPLNFHCKDRLKVLVNRANSDNAISPDDEAFLGRVMTAAMTNTWGFLPECLVTATTPTEEGVPWWVWVLGAGVVVYIATR